MKLEPIKPEELDSDEARMCNVPRGAIRILQRAPFARGREDRVRRTRLERKMHKHACWTRCATGACSSNDIADARAASLYGKPTAAPPSLLPLMAACTRARWKKARGGGSGSGTWGVYASSAGGGWRTKSGVPGNPICGSWSRYCRSVGRT